MSPPPETLSAELPDTPAAQRAAELRRSCMRGRGGPGMECLDRQLLALLEAEGPRAAMEVLDALGKLDEVVRREGHMLAHSIGLAAFTRPEEVGSVYRQCLPIFQSGCYHGVIQAYFARLSDAPGGGELTAPMVNALCSDYRDNGADRWLLFQCVHGLGHGLTLARGHDLSDALQGCDLLADPWERDGCYGGVFMENVVQATTPHHGIGRPVAGAAAAHAHHHGHEETGGTLRKGLDPGDPLYPCSVLDARYLNACYMMQTSAVLHFNRGDVAATAALCDTLADPYRATCYQSLGRDLSGYTAQNHAEGVRLCSLGDPRYRAWCHVGYAKNLVDVTAAASDGLAYCRKVPDGDSKLACYRAVGEELWVLSDQRSSWEAACAEAEPDYRVHCEEGVGLTRTRPAPLQRTGTK